MRSNISKNNIQFFSLSSIFFLIVLIGSGQIIFFGNATPTDLFIHQLLFGGFSLSMIFLTWPKLINKSDSNIVFYIFWVSLVIRITSVLWLSYFFTLHNGVPFETVGSDNMMYDQWGLELSQYTSSGKIYIRDYWSGDYSDLGYNYFLAWTYTIFGHNIILSRLFEALISSYTVVLTYKLTKYFFTKEVSVLTACLMTFSTVLIRYPALHLKETVMVFLIISGVYSAVRLMRTNKQRLTNVFVMSFSLMSLFSFRTVTGMIFIASVSIYFLFSTQIKNNKIKWLTIPIILLLLFYMFFASLARKEVSTSVEIGSGYSERVLETSESKNIGSISSLPVNMILTIAAPFPNLLGHLPVESSRLFGQNMLALDDIIKGAFGLLFLFGFFRMIKEGISKNILFLSIVFFNLLMLAYTGLMLNHRHYLPVYPFLYIALAVGIIYLNSMQKRFYFIYLVFLFLFILVFNYYKIFDYNI